MRKECAGERIGFIRISMSGLSLGSRPWQRVGFVALALSLLLVFVGTVLPAVAIGWLRAEAPSFALVWDWLDRQFPALNPLHILLYAWVAVLWRWLAPRWPGWMIVLLGGAFAAVSEALQGLSPGRTPRISDVLNDVAGMVLGLALATAIDGIRRRSSHRSPPSQARGGLRTPTQSPESHPAVHPEPRRTVP